MNQVERVREFFNTLPGRITAAGVGLVGAAVLALSVISYFGGSEAAKLSVGRTYVDAATGKPFAHELKAGDTIPIKAPSGGDTGYPAELCYWTADGQVKAEATPVLLNSYAGSKDPTFCPDCGRLVVTHNPQPQAGDRPPPSRTEYAATRAARKSAQVRTDPAAR